MEFTLQQFTAWFFKIVPFALAALIIWGFTAWQKYKERKAVEHILEVVEQIDERIRGKNV